MAGCAIIGSDGAWQAALHEQLLEGGDCRLFADRFRRFAQKQVRRGVIGDGQG